MCWVLGLYVLGVGLYVLGVGLYVSSGPPGLCGVRVAMAKTSLTSTDQHCWSSKATLQPAIPGSVPQKFKIM